MTKKQLLILSLILLPAVLFASGGSGHYESITGRTTDFFPRVINFLIFSGIVYYLVANPIKEFFVGRQKGIAKQLDEIEAKLQSSKENQKSAETRLSESKKKALEIVETAHKEAELLSSKILCNADEDSKILEKQDIEKKDLAQRKVIRNAIEDLLTNNIANSDIALDEKKVIALLNKKVA